MRIRYLITLGLFAVSIYCGATEPYSMEWKEVSITATGNKNVGNINVVASKNSANYLVMKITSNFGDFDVAEGIKDPYLHTIAIQTYSSDARQILGYELFTVCLNYGESKRVNYGTETKPNWKWQYNKVTYYLTKGNIEERIDLNDQRILISDCNP